MGFWHWVTDLIDAIIAALSRKKPKKLKRIALRLRVVDISRRKEVKTSCC